MAIALMLKIDRPFEGLDEVWIWSIPHPGDPEEPRKKRRITRLGTQEGSSLVGRMQILNRPSQTILGTVDQLQGLGQWHRVKLGKVTVRSDSVTYSTREAFVTSGGVEARWRPTGHFSVGEHVERNMLATGGHPYPPTARELGENALAMGKSLLRRVRDRGEDRTPEAEAEVDPAATPEPVELSAFDRWLVADRVESGDAVAWRITIDRHPGAPESVGLGVTLAALALVHQ